MFPMNVLSGRPRLEIKSDWPIELVEEYPVPLTFEAEIDGCIAEFKTLFGGEEFAPSSCPDLHMSKNPEYIDSRGYKTEFYMYYTGTKGGVPYTVLFDPFKNKSTVSEEQYMTGYRVFLDSPNNNEPLNVYLDKQFIPADNEYQVKIAGFDFPTWTLRFSETRTYEGGSYEYISLYIWKGLNKHSPIYYTKFMNVFSDFVVAVVVGYQYPSTVDVLDCIHIDKDGIRPCFVNYFEYIRLCDPGVITSITEGMSYTAIHWDSNFSFNYSDGISLRVSNSLCQIKRGAGSNINSSYLFVNPLIHDFHFNMNYLTPSAVFYSYTTRPDYYMLYWKGVLHNMPMETMFADDESIYYSNFIVENGMVYRFILLGYDDNYSYYGKIRYDIDSVIRQFKFAEDYRFIHQIEK